MSSSKKMTSLPVDTHKKMLQRVSDFFYRIASRKTLLLGLALTLPFPAYILKEVEAGMNAYAGKAVGPIDLLIFNFDPDRIHQLLADYGPLGRPYYARAELTADVAYPLVYTFLFCVVLSLLYRNKSYAPYRPVNVLPLLLIPSDFLENVSIITLLNRYPDPQPTVTTLCLLFSAIKWATVLAVVGLILYGLIRRAVGVRPA
jgi:hypothetical protein